MTNGGEGLGPIGEELNEFMSVFINSSAEDRSAVCNVLEAMLTITETKNVFSKQPQAGGSSAPAEQSAAGAKQPRPHYRMGEENFELLQELLDAERFSPTAGMMLKRASEIAIKVLHQYCHTGYRDMPPTVQHS